MLTALPSTDWLGHDLAEPLFRFACLPSVGLHPSRLAGMAPPAARQMLEGLTPGTPAWGRLHRHWSAALVQSQRLAPLADVYEPTLALALLPDAGWHKLQQLGGVVLAGPRIRRTIARAQVQALHTELGAPELAFAHGAATGLHPGWDASLTWGLDDIVPACARWGAALQARAMDAASPAVAARGRLRLPEAALTDAAGPLFSALGAAAALQLALSLLQHTDPAWLSLFPATH